MKTLLLIFLFSVKSFSQNKIAIIDDFSNEKSHGHLVVNSFNKYNGDLKFKPEVIELNIQNKNISFKEFINIAIDMKVKVINLSFEEISYEFNYDNFQVLKKASDSGIWIVVASGNYGLNLSPKSSPVYPCLYKISKLICVGASDNGKIWRQSNKGGWVFAFADGRLGNQVGTSFASPKVSQAIMLFYENVKSVEFDKEYIQNSLENQLIFKLSKFENQIKYELLPLSYSSLKGPL